MKIQMDFYTKSKSNLIKNIENQYLKNNLTHVCVGDTVRIGLLIQEGNKERVQFSKGVIISKNNNNLNTTITIRKVVQNVGIERVYFIHSPRITDIKILKRSSIRRAKLYYLRHRSGKATRLKQKFI
uniref:Ribosomal protein L19 n=1 Tax=Sporolithon durum TaxID=48970 RepID=A0A141SD57_9FLOR|nr:ribosomal protein L19 [Sporolithon durum]AMK96225.1 ribosomal protein L19 [Sporolithon durum]